MFWSNNNGFSERKFLIIDVGSYAIKGKVWGESMNPIVERSVGFKGYITDAYGLKNSIYKVLEGIKSSYHQEITKLYPYFTVSFKDVEFVQYEDSIPCSPRVKGEHINKIRGILEGNIKNNSQKEVLFSEITGYKILNPDNKEMAVDNPEGLSARSLTAQASFLLIPKGIFYDFVEIIKEICSEFGLKKPTILDSTVALSYGLRERYENFDLLDMGYTSTRLATVRGRKLIKFEVINFGGINIHSLIESFGIPNSKVVDILQDIFVKNKPRIIGGYSSSEIHSNVIEQQIENDLRNVLGKMSFSAIPIFSGGFSKLGNRFKLLIRSAMNTNILFPDEEILDIIGNGVWGYFQGNIHAKWDSHPTKRFGILDMILNLIKREILGGED